MADLCHRRLREAWSLGGLWCIRYVGEHPLFNQAGRRAMGFPTSGVDHQLIRLAALKWQLREYLLEHTHATPADEAVIEGLRRPIFCRGLTPLQAVPDCENNAADNPAVIKPWYPVRLWKRGLDLTHLRL